MNCIAIDDSANALELIKIHISKTPFLKLMGTYQAAPEALEVINRGQVDLIFIDIQMPDISGMEFVRSLGTQPLVVFTTAYSEYAVEGYEVNAIDYLLKPISFERFLKAANKAFEHYKVNQTNDGLKPVGKPAKHVFFKSGHELMKLNVSDIAYVESKSNYIKVHLITGSSIMSLMTMQEAMEKLMGHSFFRCHRSFIISLDHLTSIASHEVKIGSVTVPVGKRYRSEFQKTVEDFSR